MGSCSNSCVQLQKEEDIEHVRCKLSRLKKAGALYETGSDSSVLLGDKWVRVQTALVSPRRGHRTPEVQIEQAEKSRRT